MCLPDIILLGALILTSLISLILVNFCTKKTPSSISKSPSVHSVSSTHSSTTGVEELLLTDFMTRYNSMLWGSYCSYSFIGFHVVNSVQMKSY